MIIVVIGARRTKERSKVRLRIRLPSQTTPMNNILIEIEKFFHTACAALFIKKSCEMKT